MIFMGKTAVFYRSNTVPLLQLKISGTSDSSIYDDAVSKDISIDDCEDAIESCYQWQW